MSDTNTDTGSGTGTGGGASASASASASGSASAGAGSKAKANANAGKQDPLSDAEKGHGNGDARDDQEAWHVMTREQVCAMLETDMTQGLSKQVAEERLQINGPNKLTEKRKITLCERIWNQINNVLVFILIVVAIVSAAKAATSDKSSDAATSWVEVGLIILVIVLNTYIGIRQEGSAEKSAEALKAMLSSAATVIRDGSKIEVPAEDLVVGDLVSLSTGDKIPADLRMTRVSNIGCQEAALTGESLAVKKFVDKIDAEDPMQVPLGDRKNLAFSATLVSQGEGLGVVVATGDDTEIGQINTMVGQVENKKTNVLLQIDRVSKFIALFVCITAIATFLVAFFRAGQDALEAVSIALVTSVAMIPEGLAAILTLTYAYAVNNMAAHNAIIRVLPSVETLGSVTVICSDKTGTLTKNEMTMVAFVTSSGRFKHNSSPENRSPQNFTREDKYMAHDRNKKKSSKEGSFGQMHGAKLGVDEATSPSGDGGGDQIADATNDAPDAGKDKDIPVPEGQSPDDNWLNKVFSTGILCSNAILGKDGGREGQMGNPTELAIIRGAFFGGVQYEEMRKAQPIVAQVPFSSEYKFMATVHRKKPELDGDEGLVIHVKGAPDRLLAMSSHQARGGVIDPEYLEPIDRDYWTKQAQNLSSHGLRVLALCRADVKDENSIREGQELEPAFINGGEPFLTMVGLCAIMDPPRPECVDAIAIARGAGVRVAMITGDHRETALAIGDMLGIVDKKHPDALTGPELDAMSDDELRAAVMTHNVFARASPENKIRIVKALQAEKQVASMTGDGVNDAPALKAADMGVAMGKEGTDVAREASEMILADDNFATIVAAVREGRVVWDNLRKVLLFNTPVNNAQGLTVFFGLVAGLDDTPLTPIQVLYVNLICAVTLGFVLAVEPAEEGIMKFPPRKPGKKIIGKYMLFKIVLATTTLVAFTVGAVFWIRNTGDYELEDIRAQASNTLTFGAIAVCISARFAHNTVFHPRVFYGNIYCWYAVAITAVLQLVITYVPGLNNVVFSMRGMDGTQWGIVILFMFLTLVVLETEKFVLMTMKKSGFDTEDDNDELETLSGAGAGAGAGAGGDGLQEPFVPKSSQRSATMHSNRLPR